MRQRLDVILMGDNEALIAQITVASLVLSALCFRAASRTSKEKS